MRLRAYQQFKTTTSGGKRELFGLLQAGKIQAVFDYPSAFGPQLTIPVEFWLGIPSGRFQTRLTRKSRSSNPGAGGHFLVKPTNFINEYVKWLRNHFAPDADEHLMQRVTEEVASALTSKTKHREAYVLETEWDRFVTDSEIDLIQHDNVAVKSNKGVKALESWEVILVEVAAELLAEQIRTGLSDIDRTKIAGIALERAKKIVGEKRVPKTDAITKKIREILEKKNSLIHDADS
jgi:hypothetical protein